MNATLVILGCGNLGTAILSGVLSSIHTNDRNQECKLSRVIACVRTEKSAERIRALLGPSLSEHVEIEHGSDHHNNVAKGDYIILGCKPNMISKIMGDSSMQKALSEKLLISICAGITVKDIQRHLGLYENRNIIRAMPNVASSVHQSMTVIESSEISEKYSSLVTWIFSKIGSVTHLPISQMDAATALCGSGPAFFAVVLESAIDGAVTMGMPRDKATRIAAQTMKGAAELILTGDHPALLKDKVSSPGGCTTKGLLVLEEGAVRGHVARSVREATTAARLLSNPPN